MDYQIPHVRGHHKIHESPHCISLRPTFFAGSLVIKKVTLGAYFKRRLHELTIWIITYPGYRHISLCQRIIIINIISAISTDTYSQYFYALPQLYTNHVQQLLVTGHKYHLTHPSVIFCLPERFIRYKTLLA